MPLPRSLLRMTDTELAEFLSSERTCRLATVSTDGRPHVAPLWFVWHQGALWINSLRRSVRGKHLDAGSPVSLVIDAGHGYTELRGVTIDGTPEPASTHPDIGTVRQMFGDKYWNGISVGEVRSHDWWRIEPTNIASWDFRKIPAGGDKRKTALEGQ